ncbi:MAP kinase kinase Wis1 [Linnemannia schmuckeri]|uniref:mitogen-activated protein kinase kinase n=1 Tax=Linnemannia schmuckeri TaxID=64567 RepID=A0A9P5VBH8_9FUNG|nr:MAP kinase kinase Wis1 [Linnemannia schmuckeri]
MNNFPRGNAPQPARRAPPRMTLSQMTGGAPVPKPETPFSNFSRFVDPSGKLNFNGKAILHSDGVDFSNGNSFKINMEELKLLEELGKGQYGTVQKVYHKPTNVIMAMKETRLELDQSKLNSILMELDVLHKSQSPYIVDFYGAFFIETCVYYCMEYMDAGSLDKLYQIGVPEDILSNITLSMVRGLKFLKDELSIIHRDVKPTNVLVNSQGQVKLCDFGVSGQLVQSMAKTHIGCQSYMAPERISQGQTYTVQSDVWSLGLSILETAEGSYPYPPEKYNSVFAQLSAIVGNPPPALPDSYSEDARSFVALCLLKDAKERPTYAALLEHPFLTKYLDTEVDMKGWAVKAMEARFAREEEEKKKGGVPPSS